MTVTMRVNGYINIDTKTGRITGDTYRAKEWIKDNFGAKWDAADKAWVADASEIAEQLEKYAEYYAKYIVGTSEGEAGHTASDNKTIIDQQLINGKDGFYSITRYSDGTTSKHFMG